MRHLQKAIDYNQNYIVNIVVTHLDLAFNTSLLPNLRPVLASRAPSPANNTKIICLNRAATLSCCTLTFLPDEPLLTDLK